MIYGYIDVYGNLYKCQNLSHDQINYDVYTKYSQLHKKQILNIQQIQLQFKLIYNYGFVKITNSYYLGDTLIFFNKLTRHQYSTLQKTYGLYKRFYIDNIQLSVQQIKQKFIMQI